MHCCMVYQHSIAYQQSWGHLEPSAVCFHPLPCLSPPSPSLSYPQHIYVNRHADTHGYINMCWITDLCLLHMWCYIAKTFIKSHWQSWVDRKIEPVLISVIFQLQLFSVLLFVYICSNLNVVLRNMTAPQCLLFTITPNAPPTPSQFLVCNS